MADNVVVTVPEKQIIAGRDGFDPIIEVEPYTDVLGHGNIVTIKGRSMATLFYVQDGRNGLNGLSAYQQAVRGGYRGTEAQFNAVLAALDEVRPFYMRFWIDEVGHLRYESMNMPVTFYLENGNLYMTEAVNE